MALPVTIPRLGWTMEEGTFTEWLKQDGALIAEGDELFTLESDKATEAVAALASGTLRILPGGPRPGDTVRVGQVIAYLLQAGESLPLSPPEETQPTAADTPLATTPAATTWGAASPSAATRPAAPAATAAVSTAEASTMAASTAAPPLAELQAAVVQAVAPGASAAPAALQGSEHLQGRSAPQGAFRSRGRISSSPRARRTARELGLDWRTLQGSGAGGRVIERDVLRAAAALSQQAAAAPPEDAMSAPAGEVADVTTGVTGEVPVPAALSPTRRSIAQRMLASVRATAPVTLTAAVDATHLKLLRDQLRSRCGPEGDAPGYTELLIKLTALTLRRHPALCCRWVGDCLQRCAQIDLNVAVDTETGLVAPIIRKADRASLAELTERLGRLVEDARHKRLSTGDLALGCFTLSNLGMYAVDAFTPIVHYPQVAILGVGRIAPRPALHHGRIRRRFQMTLCLTFDHRALDGAPAARFLTELCTAIEQPMAWLLEPRGQSQNPEEATTEETT
ncbi:MAG: 2-oxo acid dehydrogenase subunit E2 [Pirellulales bacterium]|nr:2-oxo acid dehydrogenase subunit E2 [Pirellulales bacterium]